MSSKATRPFDRFVFPVLRMKKNESYILVSVLLKSNNSTSLGCHRASIKNANIFVRRILRNWRLIIIFNLAHWHFSRDDHRVEMKGPPFWKSDFIIGPKRSRWNLSKTWTTRKPLIFQENKHSEETKARYLEETLRATASNSCSRMVFSRTVFLGKSRYALTWPCTCTHRYPRLEDESFSHRVWSFLFWNLRQSYWGKLLCGRNRRNEEEGTTFPRQNLRS